MNKRQKIIVSITGIFIILLALVGLTYAYFLTRITGNENDKSISVTTANLELVYGDGNNLVTAANIEPGDPITPKTFTVTNNGNATVEGFNIYLEDVRNSLSRKTDMIYTITCVNTTEGATSTTCEDFEVVENEVNGTEFVFPSVMSIIARDTLEPATEDTNAEQHTYTITLTYKEMNVDQSEDMNKVISAKVNIYDSKTKFLASEIMKNTRKNGTFNYNKTEYIDPSLQDGITYTIPAEQINKENERILSYTFDDYGTSYYYRGSVEDNYVNFAGMCWRIVRIEGDGSIKLLLEDRNEQCNDTEENDLNNNGTYFTGNWSDGKYYVFGYNADGSPELINYTGTDSLVNSFKSFQTDMISNYLDDLKIDEWCFDDSVGAYEHYDENGIIVLNPVEGGFSFKYYGTSIRIGKDKKMIMKCPGTKLKKFNDNIDMYVGSLTADEIIFAGIDINVTENYNCYLNSSTKENTPSWWSLSPTSYNTRGESIGYVMFSGFLSGVGDIAESAFSSRPAVTLKSETLILDGVGTLDKPYVID